MIKRALILLLAAFCPLTGSVDYKAVIARKNAVAAPSYIHDEDFNATETPTGFSATAGSFTYDNATAPLEGAQSASAAASTDTAYADLGGTYTTIYGFLWISVSNRSVTPFVIRGRFGGTEVFSMTAKADGALQLRNSGLTTVATSATGLITDSTKFYLWWSFVENGASDVLTAYVSATTTKPGSPSVTYTGEVNAADSGITRVYMWGTNLNTSKWDEFKTDDVDIGSAPP